LIGKVVWAFCRRGRQDSVNRSEVVICNRYEYDGELIAGDLRMMLEISGHI